MKKRKDRVIGIRVDKDMFDVLQTFRDARGWKYSQTLRIALAQYFKIECEKESLIVKQN